MDLESRKIAFVQDFLELYNEAAITRLENILEEEMSTFKSEKKQWISEEELNRRIDEAEADFENNRLIESSELIKRYQ